MPDKICADDSSFSHSLRNSRALQDVDKSVQSVRNTVLLQTTEGFLNIIKMIVEYLFWDIKQLEDGRVDARIIDVISLLSSYDKSLYPLQEWPIAVTRLAIRRPIGRGFLRL